MRPETEAPETEPRLLPAPRAVAPPAPAASSAGEPGSLDQVWELGPGRASPSTHPGDRHADATLAAMLAWCVREVRARASGPVDAVVLGCGEGWIGHRLLEAGVRRVVGIDERPAAIAHGERLRDRFAFGADRLELRVVDSLLEPGPADDDPFELVVLPPAAERALPDPEARLEIARRLTGIACAIETSQRLATAAAAREAGFARLELVQPPADAERRFVLLQRALILAHPEGRP